jgi:hypothetical protein
MQTRSDFAAAVFLGSTSTKCAACMSARGRLPLSVSAMSSPQFQLLRMLQYLELSRDVKGDGKREGIGEQYDRALHARFCTPGNCRS